jgi:DeoR/GlpR family transcriptional regulator of sugar metabolism
MIVGVFVSMHAVQRHAEIIKYLEEHGFVQVSQLSKMFNVSEVTIRSDLRFLEQKGKIERKYGGAILVQTPSLPFPHTTKMLSENKEAIATAAMSFVEEGDTLLLDASSTTWHFALKLQKLSNITIITNSIPIFEIFKNHTGITLIGIPGTLNPLSESFIGPFADKMIHELRATKAFLSPKAILPEGLRDNSMLEASIRKSMIDAAAETIILADHSKFMSNSSLFGVDGFDAISTVITDRMPDDRFQRIFQEKGIRLVVA